MKEIIDIVKSFVVENLNMLAIGYFISAIFSNYLSYNIYKEKRIEFSDNGIKQNKLNKL